MDNPVLSPVGSYQFCHSNPLLSHSLPPFTPKVVLAAGQLKRSIGQPFILHWVRLSINWHNLVSPLQTCLIPAGTGTWHWYSGILGLCSKPINLHTLQAIVTDWIPWSCCRVVVFLFVLTWAYSVKLLIAYQDWSNGTSVLGKAQFPNFLVPTAFEEPEPQLHCVPFVSLSHRVPQTFQNGILYNIHQLEYNPLWFIWCASAFEKTSIFFHPPWVLSHWKLRANIFCKISHSKYELELIILKKY